VLLQSDGNVAVSQSVIFDESPGTATARPTTPVEVEEEPQLGDGGTDSDDSDGGGAAQSGGGEDGAADNASDGGASDSAQRSANDDTTAELPAGRTGRERRLPSRLQEFHVGAAAAGSPQIPSDPKTYQEAISQPDADLWREATSKEVINMETNGAWELGVPPAGAKPIPAKPVFKIKVDPDGQITKYKTRLVVRGFLEGWIGDVYAPASLITTVRTFLAMAAGRDLELGSLDVDGAFLKGELPPGTWIELPSYLREYLSGGTKGSGPVTVHLKKAMYGLKIAPKVWYETLTGALERHGFKRTSADPCLFTGFAPDGNPTYLLIYVDDVLVASKTKAGVKHGVSSILSEFEGRNLGEPTAFLGMKIERDREQRVIKISQERHVRDLLARFNMDNCYPKTVPFVVGRLLPADGEALDISLCPYTSLLGGLLYVATHTRPDISYATGMLARYSQQPTIGHWNAAKDVLRYLAGTASLKLHLGGDLAVQGWCDADWAGDLDSRRSTSGFIFKIGSGAITWGSKRQGIVTISTAESENTAACSAVREALWIKQLCGALDSKVSCLPLFSDSQAAIAIAKNISISARTKHMDVKVHFVRERVASGDVSLTYVSTNEMLADPLTKPVTGDKLNKMMKAWGLY